METREIKFRGKNLDTKEWEFGNLISTTFHDFNDEEGMVAIIPKSIYSGSVYDSESLLVHVSLETVGQYTGLKDKNGKEIYEGDLVKTKYQELAEVMWHNEFFCFCYRTIDDVVKEELQFTFKQEEIEVIGNIHENPELL